MYKVFFFCLIFEVTRDSDLDSTFVTRDSGLGLDTGDSRFEEYKSGNWRYEQQNMHAQVYFKVVK